MVLEKYILAAVTTNPRKVPSGSAVFHCESREEMEQIAKNLEAILDGIAHLLSEDLYIIVSH